MAIPVRGIDLLQPVVFEVLWKEENP